MQWGVIGLGRMGANLVRRLLRDGHECVVYDHDPTAITALASEGATGVGSTAELVEKLTAPRAVWVMVPAGPITTAVIDELADALEPGDTVIDGGNSYYRDDIDRAAGAARCAVAGLRRQRRRVGLDRGYALMIGSDADAVAQVEPVFASFAPGVGAADWTPGREGEPSTAEKGYLHCGAQLGAPRRHHPHLSVAPRRAHRRPARARRRAALRVHHRSAAGPGDGRRLRGADRADLLVMLSRRDR